ncbi:hypothetical protein ACVOMT_14020 [Sphingomonas panni]
MLRTSAWGVLAAGLSVGTPALAQSANAPAQGDPATSSTAQGDEAGVGEILVVGTRASLQSAIARKRKAETVVDLDRRRRHCQLPRQECRRQPGAHHRRPAEP